MNTASPARHARSFLFVPATKPERIAKALDSGADCIIIDLEDAVAEGSKDIAREQLAQSLPQLSAAQRVRTVVRLAFGHLDFQLDLGMRASAEEPELAFARNAIVTASRRARLPAPIDGVTTDTGNAGRLAADAQRARAFGFGGKLCIHPAQVGGANAALGYSEAEQAWALRVLEGAAQRGGEVFSLDGRMVDLPVIRAAEAIAASIQK